MHVSFCYYVMSIVVSEQSEPRCRGVWRCSIFVYGFCETVARGAEQEQGDVTFVDLDEFRSTRRNCHCAVHSMRVPSVHMWKSRARWDR